VTPLAAQAILPRVPKLTVTVITRNESANILAALESVSWADEIVVVDSNSTDDTVALARQRTDRIFVRDWPGYSAQKNFAARQASHDWILSLDADERVTPALADEIHVLLRGEPPSRGYRIPRVSFYLGKWIRSTDWYPDDQLRLYDRRVATWEGEVHEGVEVKGGVGRLLSDLEHVPYRDISHHLQTIDRYTSLAARQMLERRKTVGVAGLALRPVGAFLRNYLVRGGWRDGSVGFVVSVLNSYYVFLKFAKLWELGRNQSSRQ
jgi:glycosyltransferase involved in cell wall biosynthesis